MERKPYSGSDRSRRMRESGRQSGNAPRNAAGREYHRAETDRRRTDADYRRADSRGQRRGAQPARHTQSRRGRAQSPSGNRKPRIALRFRIKKINPIVLLICAFFLAIIIYVGSAWITVQANANTFCENITINGINMDDYTHEGGKQAVQDYIDQKLDAQHTLTYQDKSYTFTARDFNANIDADDYIERAWNIGHYGSLFSKRKDISMLKTTPMDWTVEMTYDDALINSFIDSIYNDVYVAPVDAEVTITTERPYLTADSQTGLELNKEATYEMIVNLIKTGEGSTTLPVEIAEPAISSDDASGALQVIVEVKTDVSFRDWSSRQNVRKALSNFDGMCVWPGETISYNDVVGPRTEERGYLLATEFAGNRTQKGYGGGVCQGSTTLYDAVLKAGMTIIERWPHSMTVTYVDPSMDAAVSESGKDFVFKNDTDHAIYIYTSVDKDYATVTIWGNRTEYRYELESTITRKASECKYTDYINDEDGTYVWSVTGEPVLYKKGKPELESEGWLVSYDWETGEEVKRYQLSHDSYSSGTTYYWRGVHDPDTGEVVDPDEYAASHSK